MHSVELYYSLGSIELLDQRLKNLEPLLRVANRNLSMVRTALESEEKAKEVLEKLEADVAELEQDAKNIMMAKVLLFRGM